MTDGTCRYTGVATGTNTGTGIVTNPDIATNMARGPSPVTHAPDPINTGLGNSSCIPANVPSNPTQPQRALRGGSSSFPPLSTNSNGIDQLHVPPEPWEPGRRVFWTCAADIIAWGQYVNHFLGLGFSIYPGTGTNPTDIIDSNGTDGAASGTRPQMGGFSVPGAAMTRHSGDDTDPANAGIVDYAGATIPTAPRFWPLYQRTLASIPPHPDTVTPYPVQFHPQYQYQYSEQASQQTNTAPQQRNQTSAAPYEGDPVPTQQLSRQDSRTGHQASHHTNTRPQQTNTMRGQVPNTTGINPVQTALARGRRPLPSSPARAAKEKKKRPVKKAKTKKE